MWPTRIRCFVFVTLANDFLRNALNIEYYIFGPIRYKSMLVIRSIVTASVFTKSLSLGE